MALRIILDIMKKYWYVPMFLFITVTGFLVLFQTSPHHRQVILDPPKYYQDPRAPKVCICYWRSFAFRVPCEDIPPALLKE